MVSIDSLEISSYIRLNRREDELHIFFVRYMTNDTKNLLHSFSHREVAFVQFKGVVLHLRQVQQVHHQVTHDLRAENHHFNNVSSFLHEILQLLQLNTHLLVVSMELDQSLFLNPHALRIGFQQLW